MVSVAGEIFRDFSGQPPSVKCTEIVDDVSNTWLSQKWKNKKNTNTSGWKIGLPYDPDRRQRDSSFWWKQKHVISPSEESCPASCMLYLDTSPHLLLLLWTRLTWTISCCVLHVWKPTSGKCPDQVHVWKQLLFWLYFSTLPFRARVTKQQCCCCSPCWHSQCILKIPLSVREIRGVMDEAKEGRQWVDSVKWSQLVLTQAYCVSHIVTALVLFPWWCHVCLMKLSVVLNARCTPLVKACVTHKQCFTLNAFVEHSMWGFCSLPRLTLTGRTGRMPIVIVITCFVW